MRRFFKKYASAIFIIGAILIPLGFGVETLIYGGCVYRPYYPADKYTVPLLSVTGTGLIMVILGFIFYEKESSE